MRRDRGALRRGLRGPHRRRRAPICGSRSRGARCGSTRSGANLPGGEFFGCPIEDSAEGEISFGDFPAVYRGREVDRDPAALRGRRRRRCLGRLERGVPARDARHRRGRAPARRARDRLQPRHHPLHEEHALRREDGRHRPPRAREQLHRSRRRQQVGDPLGPGQGPAAGRLAASSSTASSSSRTAPGSSRSRSYAAGGGGGPAAAPGAGRSSSMCCQRFSSIRVTGQKRRRAAEVERAGGEHACAGRRLVVGHLAAQPRPEQVGDAGEHHRSRRRVGRRRVDLDPVAADRLAERRAGREARLVEQPRRRLGRDDGVRPLARAVVVGAVLRRRSGAPRAGPRRARA